MTSKGQSGEEPDSYDIHELLQYRGPILRKDGPIEDGISIVDYLNSDKNERNIAVLLSSLGIHFTIERPAPGWKKSNIRMIVTVPRTQVQSAEAVLTAASAASAVEIVSGIEDLRSR